MHIAAVSQIHALVFRRRKNVKEIRARGGSLDSRHVQAGLKRGKFDYTKRNTLERTILRLPR